MNNRGVDKGFTPYVMDDTLEGLSLYDQEDTYKYHEVALI